MKKGILVILLLNIGFFTSYGQVTQPTVDTANKRLIFNSKSHLNDFITFYTSDDSEDELDQIIETLENKGFESLLNIEKRIIYLQSNGISVFDENIEDDIVIGDDRFASLLNNQREIVVENKIFKYEEDGLYFTEETNSDINQKISAKKSSNKSYKSYPTEVINGDTIYNLENNLKFFSYNYKSSVNYNDDYNISENSYSESASNDTSLIPYNLNYCNFDNSGFFESILPGSEEVCINQINNDKRIRTKFSSQNYFLFSSVYTKVKSQKKGSFLGITTWSRDNFCEYLEMGRTVVIKFPLEYPKPPVFTNSFLVKDNAYNRVIDINGNTKYTNIQGMSNVFEKFPFDDYTFNYEIYLYVGTYDPTPKDINKLVADGIEGLLKSLGKSFDDLFGKDTNTSVGMTFDTPDGIYITEYGEKSRKYGTSKISKTYDWNFELKFKTSTADFFGDLIKNINLSTFTNAKSYEVTVLDVYGFGSYNGSIYGSRIVKGDLNDNSNNGIDSDADGVPDDEDFCPYQKGVKKYGGCPYSLLDKQALYANRINDYTDNTHSISSKTVTTSNTQTFGSCYDLEIKSADYPLVTNKAKGGISNYYNIVAGNKITINGQSNISIKPEGNTQSITLKIESNPCDIIQPSSNKQIISNNTAKNNTSLNKEALNTFKIYPNPTSNLITIENIENIASWELINNLGNTLIRGSNESSNTETFILNLSTYETGLYFIRIHLTNGDVIIKKVVKN